MLEKLRKIAGENEYAWKKPLEQMMKMEIDKLGKKLDYVQECENTVKELKVFSDPNWIK